MTTTGENSLGWHGQTILMRPDLADNAVLRRLPALADLPIVFTPQCRTALFR